MTPYKLIVKLPADFTDVSAGLFVNMFHRWIQEQSVADHLPIDVADYAHVAGGPGTILVCSEANIHVDSQGLTYVRKRPFVDAATLEESVTRCVRTAIGLAEKIEADPAITGHFHRRTGEIRIQFNDRLMMPNTAEAATAVIPPVKAAMNALFPDKSVSVAVATTTPLELLELAAVVS
jgi:hypothetical protein